MFSLYDHAYPSPLTLATTLWFYITVILSFGECYRNRIKVYNFLRGAYCTWDNIFENYPSFCMYCSLLLCVCWNNIVWLYQGLFIDSLVEGNLCCFQVLVIMNRAIINIRVQVFFFFKCVRKFLFL